MPVDRMEQIISVFGSFDRNMHIVESELAVKVVDREAELHITGEAENVMLAEKAIIGLLSLAARGENIDEQNVRYIIKLVREGAESKIDKIAGDVICITSKGQARKSQDHRTEGLCRCNCQEHNYARHRPPQGRARPIWPSPPLLRSFRDKES